MKKIISFISALIISLTSCGVETPKETAVVSGEFQVHYIDVGQADCSLLICGDDAMLIDGGNADDSSLVVTYLRKLGIEKLDYMVCTHAHEDHVGGLSGPLNTVTVENVYAPETEADSKVYNNFKKSALKNAGEIKNPKYGEIIELGDAKITFLAPVREDYEDLNNTSIILKAEFGETSFLFTGDAERDAEYDLMETGADIRVDVLKVGHHGSGSSTSYRFLNEVMPRYAVIQVGKDNSYGHPHDEVLSRLRDAEVEVFRTDENGDIIATSDGKNITFETKKSVSVATDTEKEYDYIGNKNSKTFHKSTCNALPTEKNRVYFSKREDAVNGGFKPCGNCKP